MGQEGAGLAGVGRPAVSESHDGRQAVEAVWRIESARIVGVDSVDFLRRRSPELSTGGGTSDGRFLIELCRPSHLGINPFLRGFYFTSGTQQGTPIDQLIGALSKSLKREVCQIVVQNAIPFPRGEYQHPIHTTAEEQDRLSIRFLPGNVRRRAVVWLSRLGRDSHELLKRLLKPNTVRGYGGDQVASGALDLLDERWFDIEEEIRLGLLRKAADLPDTAVRKRAYILGEKYLGIDFLRQSLDDKAKSLREWARERLDRREAGEIPSEEELAAELEEDLEETSGGADEAIAS